MGNSVFDRFRLGGRVAVITGGAGFLGRQYTRTLLAAGARVVVADLDGSASEQAARDALAESGGEAAGVALDVTRPSSVAAMVRHACERFGAIDILVNNAAVDPKFDAGKAEKNVNTFEDYPLELWQQSLDVNLTGVFLCCQEVGRIMVRQRRGVVVNVSSTYGVVAPDQRLYQRDGEARQTLFKPAAYPVTKAAVAHLTRYLAVYWADHGIRVNTLTPHGVANSHDEQFLRRFADRSPLKRMAAPHEMNGALLFLVSDASAYMTGGNLVVDGGWTAW